MPLTREQTKYTSTNDTVFLPIVAIDRNLGVRGTSVFDGFITANSGLYSVLPSRFGNAATAANSPRVLNLVDTNAVMNVRRHSDTGAPAIELRAFREDGTTLTTYWDMFATPALDLTNGAGKFAIRDRTNVDVTRFVIDTVGNIGIGTTSPTQRLTVRGGRIVAQANSEPYSLQLEHGPGLGQYYIGATNSVTPDLVFSNNSGTERMRIDNAGNVGIGISPSFKLDVSGGSARFNSGSEWSIYHRFSGATSTNRNHIIFQRDNAGAATTNGFTLGGIGMAGYDGTNYGLGWNGGVEITAFAAETWTAAARGTNFTISNTTIGTNSPTERLRINGDAFGTTTLSGNVIQNVNTTAKSAAYTLTTADANTLVQMNGAFAFTVPLNSTTAFPTGTTINLLALTTGVSVTFTGGITSYATPGTKLRAAGSMATLIKLGTDTWVLTGDLTA